MDDYWRLQIKNKRFKKAKLSKMKRIPTYNIIKPKKDNEKYYLGKFKLGSTNNILPNDWVQCMGQLDDRETSDFLNITFDEEYNVVITLLTDASFIIGILSTKIFLINFEQDENEIYMLLYFMELPLLRHNKNIGNTLKLVFSVLFDISDNLATFKEYSDELDCQFEVLADTYKTIRSMHATERIPKVNLESSQLKPTLRPYQMDAVRWMIHRETNPNKEEDLHPCFCLVKLPSGCEIYYDKYSGYIELNKPVIEPLRSGGILADEMGLGKTVEVLTCIIMNPKIPETTNKQSKMVNVELEEVSKNIKFDTSDIVGTENSIYSEENKSVENNLNDSSLMSMQILKPEINNEEQISILEPELTSTNMHIASEEDNMISNIETNNISEVNNSIDLNVSNNSMEELSDDKKLVQKKMYDDGIISPIHTLDTHSKLTEIGNSSGNEEDDVDEFPFINKCGKKRRNVENSGLIIAGSSLEMNDNSDVSDDGLTPAPTKKSRRRIINRKELSDDSSQDDALEAKNTSELSNLTPIIFMNKKKRAKRHKVKPKKRLQETQGGKVNIPNNWVKKPKSQTKLALEMWYDSVIKSVNDRGCSVSVPKVKCVCGSIDEEDSIECIDCGLYQHISCVGYQVDFGEYRCPQCWLKQPLIESKATLIVSPVSIKDQWCDEICKHVNSDLKILQYGGKNVGTVYPASLKNYDVVITTYTTLQAELRLSENIESKSLRRQSKYLVHCSPISLIKWWRLCLDEAQTVESSNSMVSEMARKLTAYHRWAVTGTPISKGLSDLYGLIDFLQFDPYYDVDIWNNILYKPFISGNKEPMHTFLSQILWRTAKNDILDQINIPMQTTEIHIIEFTPVESYFYVKEHELCSLFFLHALKNFNLDLPLKNLSKSDLKKILSPLLSLRQACAHHNAVRGRYLATKKSVNSMEELLNALIGKVIAECEDHLRATISAHNGLAGIYILQNNKKQAIEEYNKVLQIGAKFQDEKLAGLILSIDTLQLIHTKYNMADIMDDLPSDQNSSSDNKLHKDSLELETKYLQKFSKQTITAMDVTRKISNEVTLSQDKLELELGQWYSIILEFVSINDLTDELHLKISTSLEKNNYVTTTTSSSWNERRVLYIVKTWDDEINALREDTMDIVNDLYTIEDDQIVINKSIVISAATCHLRPIRKAKQKPKPCVICITNLKLKEYESKLFHSVQNSDNSNKGNWKPSMEEQIMKAIYYLGRMKHMDKKAISDGRVYLNILDLYKKEFKELRKLWTYLDAQICASDEVEICKIRLRLKDNSEDPQEKPNQVLRNLSYNINNRTDTINQLSEHELDYQKLVIAADVAEQSSLLEKCLGTHKYLQTLHEQQNSGQTPDPCPICKNPLENRCNIFQCGHCYCLDCMQMLIGNTGCSRYIVCSICREKQSINEINFVELSKNPVVEEAIKIKGNFSTKVEAIVRLIFKLLKDDPKIKILVFSNWIILLKLLKQVFIKNDISSEILSSANVQTSIKRFKNIKLGITALLLPIKLGAKGLNLIEATHVIFVEPVLDPADQLQAIGRVHRIGQTKPTVVHTFLMKNTIEESIHSATSANAENWDKNKVTIRQIKDLFLSNKEEATESSEVVEVESVSEEQNEVDDSEVVEIDSVSEVDDSEVVELDSVSEEQNEVDDSEVVEVESLSEDENEADESVNPSQSNAEENIDSEDEWM